MSLDERRCCDDPDHGSWHGPVLTREELDAIREKVLKYDFDSEAAVREDVRRADEMPAWLVVGLVLLGFVLALLAAIGGAP